MRCKYERRHFEESYRLEQGITGKWMFVFMKPFHPGCYTCAWNKSFKTKREALEWHDKLRHHAAGLPYPLNGPKRAKTPKS
jgi:hypothetical protein